MQSLTMVTPTVGIVGRKTGQFCHHLAIVLFAISLLSGFGLGIGQSQSDSESVEELEQSEALQLASLVAFFSCDCSGDSSQDSTTQSQVSSWCHCANPYILPKKFEPETTKSYQEQLDSYVRPYTCEDAPPTNSNANANTIGSGLESDRKCQMVSSFQALERTVTLDSTTASSIGVNANATATATGYDTPALVSEQSFVFTSTSTGVSNTPAATGFGIASSSTSPSSSTASASGDFMDEMWIQTSVNGSLTTQAEAVAGNSNSDSKVSSPGAKWSRRHNSQVCTGSDRARRIDPDGRSVG